MVLVFRIQEPREEVIMSIEKAFGNEKVWHLKLHTPLCVEEGTTLRDTIRQMQERNTGCVNILRKKRVVGVFTERDILRKVIMARFPLDEPISKHMTEEPVVASKDASVGEIISIMEQNEVRHVPLVDNRREFVGIVSIRNIIDFLAEHYPAEVLNLPPQLHQKIHNVDGG